MTIQLVESSAVLGGKEGTNDVVFFKAMPSVVVAIFVLVEVFSLVVVFGIVGTVQVDKLRNSGVEDGNEEVISSVNFRSVSDGVGEIVKPFVAGKVADNSLFRVITETVRIGASEADGEPIEGVDHDLRI